IGVLGTSAMVPALPGPGWQPPWSLGADPHPYLVVSLGAAALVLGGLGLLAALAVPPASFPAGLSRSLVLLGCLAAGLLAFLPPSGSGDHLNYAGYGRLAALGIDPYTHGAVDLPGDPVADAVEDSWREEPSVYGPVATAVHFAASWLAGDSVRLTIFLLALVNAAAFIATGLLIDRFVRDDPGARPRAAPPSPRSRTPRGAPRCRGRAPPRASARPSPACTAPRRPAPAGSPPSGPGPGP